MRLDQFGNRARTGGQDEWRVPFVQYPIYDRSCHTSQSAHCNLCGNDQTSTHAVLKWSGVAAALVNPPLLGPLSHNYASPVVCLDLLWCIRARIYTRDWSPRGHDRNLESPRKSTLDFREAGRDDNDSRATRTKHHGRRLRNVV